MLFFYWPIINANAGFLFKLSKYFNINLNAKINFLFYIYIGIC